jgi:hypothetical protein
MRRFDLRIAFRLHRFEIVGFGVLIGLLAIAAVVTAGMLDATGYGARCWTGTQTPDCEAMGRAFWGLQNTQVPMVESILLALPFLFGLLAGAPLVARELERGTSRLAWSLAPSRLRWLVVRVVPIAVLVFALAFVAGAALDRLWAAISPGRDMANAFDGFGSRGVVLAARAAFVFAVGVAVGATIGKVLPALMVTAVIAWVGLAGGSYVHGKILATEAVWVATDTGTGSPGDLFFDQRVQLADGRLVSWDEALAQAQPIAQAQPMDPAAGDGLPPGARMLALVVPGARYRLVELREVGALAGGSLVALGIAGVAVRRRRPG